MRIKDVITEGDNQTLCAIRVIGFCGVALMGSAVLIGTGIAEVGIGISAIITAIGAGIKLKGDGDGHSVSR